MRTLPKNTFAWQKPNTYNVVIKNDHEVLSTFQIEALNLTEAKAKAAMQKRQGGFKGRVKVYRSYK